VIRFTERWPQQQVSQQSVVANLGLSGMQGFAAATQTDAGIDSRWPTPALSFGPTGMPGPLLLTPSFGAEVNQGQ
jgi:hypothetical protein